MRKKIVIPGAAILALLAIFWATDGASKLRSVMGGGRTGGEVAGGEEQGKATSRGPRDESAIIDRRLKPLHERGKHRVSEDQIQRYFDAVGRTDRSVATVFWLTNDPKFLRELRNFPDSAMALRVLGALGTDPKVAEADARKLLEMDPANPAANYLVGMWEARRGDLAKAMESLKKSVELDGDISVDTLELHRGTVEALNLMGYDEVEANVYLLGHPLKALTGGADFNRIMYAMLREGAAPEADQARYASELLEVCQKEASPTPTSEWSKWTQLKSEINLLAELPDDLAYGEGNTIGARREEVRALMKTEGELVTKAGEAIRGAEPETANTYFKMVGEKGAPVAREWLLKQTSGTTKP